MERSLSIVSALMIVGCLSAGLLALSSLAAGDDLRGLVYCGVTLSAGLAARRMLGVGDD